MTLRRTNRKLKFRTRQEAQEHCYMKNPDSDKRQNRTKKKVEDV